MTTKTTTLDCYQAVVVIIKDYLGPASERFVARQISFHLDKPPEQLSKQDIPKLAERIRVALSLLTQNETTVEEAAVRIASLGK